MFCHVWAEHGRLSQMFPSDYAVPSQPIFTESQRDVKLNPFLGLFYGYSFGKIAGVSQAKTGECRFGFDWTVFPRDASPCGTSRRPATRRSCGN